MIDGATQIGLALDSQGPELARSAASKIGKSCTDCHDPHSARLKHDGNKVCTSCHQHSGAKYDSLFTSIQLSHANFGDLVVFPTPGGLHIAGNLLVFVSKGSYRARQKARQKKVSWSIDRQKVALNLMKLNLIK